MGSSEPTIPSEFSPATREKLALSTQDFLVLMEDADPVVIPWARIANRRDGRPESQCGLDAGAKRRDDLFSLFVSAS